MIEIGEAFLPLLAWCVNVITGLILYMLPREARVRLFAGEFDRLLYFYRGALTEADIRALTMEMDCLLEWYRL